MTDWKLSNKENVKQQSTYGVSAWSRHGISVSMKKNWIEWMNAWIGWDGWTTQKKYKTIKTSERWGEKKVF